MKRQALMAFVAGIVIITISAYTDRQIIKVNQSDSSAINKSTCINGFDSLKEAKVQKKMLDRQVLLSSATGRTEDAALVGTQSTKLKGIITVLETLIADPKLGCGKYLKAEPTVI